MTTLRDLGLEGPAGEVRGLSHDSREVRDGWVFFAYRGTRMDGAEFAPFALRQGALAVVCTPGGAETIRRIWAEEGRGDPAALPLVIVESPREALARAAAVWFGAQPAVEVAVTGTNGKTSVASFLRQIWSTLGRRAVNVGTVGVEGAVETAGSLTTPDPIRLHSLLADLAEAGVTHAALEASSHGLDQRRVDGLRLTAAGLTNVTRDHLDYHGTMEAYVEAKLTLFGRVLPRGAAAVLNADDPAFDQAQAICRRRRQRVISVGRAGALRILGQDYDGDGQTLRFCWEGREREVRLALIGGFQAENALIAAGLAIASGEDADAAFAALERLDGVRGRMEPVARRGNGGRVFVDYAHTPEGLASAIRALRPHIEGRIVLVFGAGGDRDKGKRPLMGRAATAADVALVTDDNPRGESPAAIRAEVLAGMEAMDFAAKAEVDDRSLAILEGVDRLGPGDALLIAGKGHETGQILGDVTIPFDDAEQARAAVAALDGHEDGSWDGEIG
ncbi:MAG: UDP-N-acetylmuramoyl-L-alanyl-D-glutamate--2,6-diaminopimelate ligase [Paracoccaceae bacterium]